MVLIFMNFGGVAGGGRWWVGPLITLLPFLLTSGLLAVPLQLLSLLFGFRTAHTWVYNPHTQLWERQGTRAAAGRTAATIAGGAASAAGGTSSEGEGYTVLDSLLTGLTSMIVTAVLTVLLFKLIYGAQRNGWRASLRQLLFEGFGGGQAGQQQQQQGQGRRPVARTRSERIERVAHLMQALPLEVYRSREELDHLPVAELKRLLKKRGGACEDCLEKRELVEALLSSENSSAATCTVCCEDYESEDVLRVLHCGHRFHLECIDRWLLSSTDYSRAPACPICNAELDSGPGAGAGGGTQAAAASGGGGTGAAT